MFTKTSKISRASTQFIQRGPCFVPAYIKLQFQTTKMTPLVTIAATFVGVNLQFQTTKMTPLVTIAATFVGVN